MIGVISDIHGNYVALQEVLKILDKMNIPQIFCLGDIVGYYPQVNECCHELRKRNVFCIMGNHDWYMSADSFCPRSKSVNDCLYYQQKYISVDNKNWLSSLPSFYRNNDIFMVHGGWSDPLDEYLSPTEEYFSKLTGKYFFSGHTHVQQFLDFGKKKYCNPGSVGQPRDGDCQAAFAVFDGADIELLRVRYDYEKIGHLMELAGFSGYYYSCLKNGAKNLGFH